MEYTDSSFLATLSNKDFSAMFATMEKETLTFYAEFDDAPERISGWGHNWFCPEDGGRLVFDLNHSRSHVCEICGKAYNTELFYTVWVYNYRNEAFLTIWKAAILYKARKELRFLEIFKKLLSFYMNNYDSFKLHDKTGATFNSLETAPWGCGKIMPQGLNEALVCIRAVNAIEMLKNDLDSEFLSQIKNIFIPKVFALLKPQADKIHNIPCWINSAIGVLGLFAQNREMIDFAFKGQFNSNRQLREGVTKEGFWYEGSIHYNFFTLEGVMSLLLFARIYNEEFAESAILKKMLEAAYYYAFDSNQLPNPNDGWPNINLKTYSFIYAMGVKAFDDELIADMYRDIINSDIPRTQVPLSRPYYFDNRIPLEHLVLLGSFDTTPKKTLKRTSVLYADSNFIMLRNGHFNVFCKYGHNGPSHAHPDKMTIEIIVGNRSLSRDLSNSGYGVTLCNEWHRMTISHNTVAINGENQLSYRKGEAVNFTETSFLAIARGVYTNRKTETIRDLKESLNPDELVLYLCRNLHIDEATAQMIIAEKETIDINTGDNEIDYERAINLDGKTLTDIFTVVAQKRAVMDYFFHSEATLLTQIKTIPFDSMYNRNGYQHLKNACEIVLAEKTCTLEWDLDGIRLESIIEPNGAKVILCDSLDNPVVTCRKTILLRAQGDRHSFKITWKIKN